MWEVVSYQNLFLPTDMLPNYYQCQCPHGYAGNGMGPYGCAAQSGSTQGSVGSPCSPSPCLHGTCLPTGTSYVCQCNAGYAGQISMENLAKYF